MKRNQLLIPAACCLLFLVSFTRQVSSPWHTLRLHFSNRVGNAALVLGNSYLTPLGDSISVQRFKYYVSHIVVTDTKGRSSSFPNNYYLVDAEDSASLDIHLMVPATTVKNIRFLLGVDSTRNVSGVQTGALDPLHGMFWTWNSGYIMAKLEGTSPVAKAAGQRFTYHVGGFRQGSNTTRMISLDLPRQENISVISIDADVNAWFRGKFNLKIGEHTVCHSPGDLAVKIADNYSRMFSIAAVQ